MTVDSPSPAPTPRRPRRGLGFVLAAVLLALVILVALLVLLAYLARRTVAREALVGWLDARGVPAAVEVERFELDGFVGRIRAGTPADPEFTVERAEVKYALKGFWSGDPLGADVRSVRLVRPVLRAGWKDGKLSLGPLDRLIEELSKQPPRPNVRQPRIWVEGGQARLATPYGPVRIVADAQLNDGKLLRLEGRLEPTTLAGKDFRARLGAGRVSLVTKADRVDLRVEAAADEVAAAGGVARGVTARLTGQGPYPDFKARKGDGALSLNLVVDGRTVKLGADSLDGLHAVATFAGRTDGWVDSLTLGGDARLALSVGQGVVAGAQARGLGLAVVSKGARWTRTGGDMGAAPLQVTAQAAGLKAADLDLAGLQGTFAGTADWRPGGWGLRLNGGASTRGAWRGLGPPQKADAAELAALKRALAQFSARAPAVSVVATQERLAVSLPAPARMVSGTGLAVDLAALRGAPVYADGAGALQIAARGGGLPSVDLVADRYALTAQGFTAQGSAAVKGSFGLVRDGEAKAAGRLSGAAGAIAFTSAGCIPIRAGKLDLGDNDVEAVAGSLCPTAQPLLRLAGGGWRLVGEAKGFSAKAPFLLARVEGAGGPVDAHGVGADMSVDARVEAAQLIDAAEPLRFHPLRGAGALSLRQDVWRGAFRITDPAGRALATAELHHDGAKAAGGMTIDTGDLTFAEGGLQPAALSPLAEAVGSPASGQARFTGAFQWTPAASSSHGELALTGLGFRSPAGVVTDLSGRIQFTSLAPLATAPDQQLTVAQVDTLAPVTHGALKFQIADEALKVAAAGIEVGGGHVRLEPLVAPLTPGAVIEGVMVVEGVQLSDIVERSPFADRVDLQAKVSGRLPFILGPDGVRFQQGRLEAIEPGRISIRREAVVQVAVPEAPVLAPQGAPAAAAPAEDFNAVTDLAYQAMEDLNFETLAAEVNSLPEGRLGVLFKVVGEHAPPQKQRIRLGIMELIRRDFLKRKLPLPSGTKVNLTLDTSINLDQLLADFARSQRPAGSAGVQP